MRVSLHFLAAALMSLALATPASAEDFTFPGFAIRDIASQRRHDPCPLGRLRPGRRAAARLRRHRRHVGAARRRLARDHTVIVPDLRGFGKSSRPPGGFDKMTQAQDVDGVIPRSASTVRRRCPDIGNMVAFEFAARYPERVRRLVVIDAPVPGVGPWGQLRRTRSSGTSALSGPIWSGWLPAASGSTSTVSLTNSRPLRRVSAKPRGSTMPRFIRFRARCTRLCAVPCFRPGRDRQP